MKSIPLYLPGAISKQASFQGSVQCIQTEKSQVHF